MDPQMTETEAWAKIRAWMSCRTDAERDRIIQAQDWRSGDYGDDGEPRCMVAHALGLPSFDSLTPDEWGTHEQAAYAFDDLCLSARGPEGLGGEAPPEIVARVKLLAGEPLPVVAGSPVVVA